VILSYFAALCETYDVAPKAQNDGSVWEGLDIIRHYQTGLYGYSFWRETDVLCFEHSEERVGYSSEEAAYQAAHIAFDAGLVREGRLD